MGKNLLFTKVHEEDPYNDKEDYMLAYSYDHGARYVCRM